MSNVLAVVGAQYGSEGKGAIVSALANQYDVHVRVGGPNAGHTIYYNDTKFKMQIIPCGWTNPDAVLVIGRGAIVNIELLMREIEEIKKYDTNIMDRLVIDAFAGVLDPSFAKQEGHTDGELHQRIGSTGEGVGAARIARIERNPEKFKLMHQIAWEYGIQNMIGDTTIYLNTINMEGSTNILLEGTQGFGLSLIHGPWPYVTSADTNAAQLAVDTGLSPRAINQILLVARTFPIRVAGNSGPLSKETTWESISERVGKKVEERTTVTNKIRRIGEWDDILMDRAVMINRPTSVALTFMDYLNPKDTDINVYDDLSDVSKDFIRYIENVFNTRVSMIKTGENNESIIIRGKV